MEDNIWNQTWNSNIRQPRPLSFWLVPSLTNPKECRVGDLLKVAFISLLAPIWLSVWCGGFYNNVSFNSAWRGARKDRRQRLKTRAETEIFWMYLDALTISHKSYDKTVLNPADERVRGTSGVKGEWHKMKTLIRYKEMWRLTDGEAWKTKLKSLRCCVLIIVM